MTLVPLLVDELRIMPGIIPYDNGSEAMLSEIFQWERPLRSCLSSFIDLYLEIRHMWTEGLPAFCHTSSWSQGYLPTPSASSKNRKRMHIEPVRAGCLIVNVVARSCGGGCMGEDATEWRDPVVCPSSSAGYNCNGLPDARLLLPGPPQAMADSLFLQQAPLVGGEFFV